MYRIWNWSCFVVGIVLVFGFFLVALQTPEHDREVRDALGFGISFSTGIVFFMWAVGHILWIMLLMMKCVTRFMWQYIIKNDSLWRNAKPHWLWYTIGISLLIGAPSIFWYDYPHIETRNVMWVTGITGIALAVLSFIQGFRKKPILQIN